MLFSPVMICNIINAFLGGVVVVLLTTYLPMYFKDVIHVNIEEVGSEAIFLIPTYQKCTFRRMECTQLCHLFANGRQKCCSPFSPIG